jgi:serine/threonine-protein kinase
METAIVLRPRQRLGKYRIDGRLAEGGYAHVYRAYDTVEGIPVALKIPTVASEGLSADDICKEVRITARLVHENIVPIKNAEFLDGRLVVAYPLGDQSLADRLRSRLAIRTALAYADQMLAALAYAHRRRVIHCDIKPENFILFENDVLKLADFGIARLARGTLPVSGSGTVGYVAPEQALGKTSFRSDVFSMGLVLYRMFAGRLPEWPYEWPLPGVDRLQRNFRPEMIGLLRRAIDIDSRRRFADAEAMRTAFLKVRNGALNGRASKTRRRRTSRTDTGPAWKEIRRKQFVRLYSRALATRHACSRCEGPVSEAMQCCPWCGASRRTHDGESSFPAACHRCKRGMKLDWRFCAWCFGPGYEPHSNKEYGDVRYSARCHNASCSRHELMPYMRYCPWCRAKVRRRWRVPDPGKPCRGCGWGVLTDYWDYCPWCSRRASHD